MIISTFSDLLCNLCKADYTQKQESGVCLENATMIQIQDMFENEKPDIVLKTVRVLI